MKVVVVESSRVMARGVASLLAQRGHETVIFTDSVEALAFVRADEKVDAVLTGLETSPLDGFETCWALRLIANAGRPLYVIAMSSLAHTRSLSEVLDAGADDFISKPLVAEELHARLRAAERMTRLQRALWHQAQRDLLSGLLNRRAFFTRMAGWNEDPCDDGSMGLILADLDHFKRLNDCHGHDCGDEAIRRVGSLFDEHARAHAGAAARFGGEEFILALPGCDAGASEPVAESLRRSIATIRFLTDTGATITLTGSFGITAFQRGETVEIAIKRADDALYEAKHYGRNRVCIKAYDDAVTPRRMTAAS
ncbi:diguanylate cyclase [Saliniramus sp.]|uniref:GGDEF domain-containing protein n=1 Tax=Saliniramus sp. TaxID=2986772 RepID=UPI002D03E791|nr:diguanylate cyclase [Saliniramus sp.]HMB09312.1 diguanylate cyclase [Saliniramus sp.]